MPDFITVERKRESIRRANVLGALDACDPVPIRDTDLLNHLQQQYPDAGFTLTKVKKDMKYLDGHGLALLRYGKDDNFWDVQNGGTWSATISSQGVDYLAGYGENIPGVFRSGD
jgi:hypothetical protein